MNSRGPRMTTGFSDVDIESGTPLEDTRAVHEARAIHAAQAHLAESQATRIALDSYEGNLLLSRLRDALDARVEELIQADPQCQGMLRIVDVFAVKLKLGHRAAERLTAPLQRRPIGLAQEHATPLGPEQGDATWPNP